MGEVDEGGTLSLPWRKRLHDGSVLESTRASAAARLVAKMIINFAGRNRILNQTALCCKNCGYIPIEPITGRCGHTRCHKCVCRYGECPCGTPAPARPRVNTLVQGLVSAMQLKEPRANSLHRTSAVMSLAGPSGPNCDVSAAQTYRARPIRHRHRARYHHRFQPSALERSSITLDDYPRTAMLPKHRYEHALRLMQARNYHEAVPHLALVAATGYVRPIQVENVLAKIIDIISAGQDPRYLIRPFHRAVRKQCVHSWLRQSDLECIFCVSTMVMPITTPCGHTFCRTCIQRSLAYRKRCPLCQGSLVGFNVTANNQTEFVSALLWSIGSTVIEPLREDVIMLFVYTVAYPTVACPLQIFGPRNWQMIKRVINSETRQFGMVLNNTEQHGTLLEVRDCVFMEDGRSIVSTVGVSRFRIKRREKRDGCDVAYVEPLIDREPDVEEIQTYYPLCRQIACHAIIWLNWIYQGNPSRYQEITDSFGEPPAYEAYVNADQWWLPDGPAWHWWLINLLPLKNDLRQLVLSSKCLKKRLMALLVTIKNVVDDEYSFFMMPSEVVVQ